MKNKSLSLLSLSTKPKKKKIELSEGGHVGSAWQDNNKPKQLIGKVRAPATGRSKRQATWRAMMGPPAYTSAGCHIPCNVH